MINDTFTRLRSHPATPWLFLALCLVPSALTHFKGVVLPEDDAFIIYRYVQNVIAGNGLVYNPGEKVFGSTTPLYTIWLCMLKTVFPGSDIAALSVRGNFIFFAAACAGLFCFLRGLLRGAVWAFLGAGYFALQTDLIEVSVSGMESLLFAALCFWAFNLAITGRIRSACMLAGFSVITRPEGVFCMLAIAGLLNWRSFRQLVYCGLNFIAPVLTWVIPAWVYYGTPIPHSVLAKSAPLYPLQPYYTAEKMVERMDWWITRVFPESLIAGPPPGWLMTITTGVCLIIFGAAVAMVLKRGLRDQRFLPVAVFPLALFLFYTISNPLMMRWYWAVPHAAWVACLLVVGCWVLNDWLQSRGSVNDFVLKVKPFIVLVGLCVWMLAVTGWTWGNTINFIQEPFNPYSLGRDRNPTLVRIVGYQRAAAWLNDNFDERPKIAAPEIGALGYYYRGPVLDTCGLISPEAIPYYPLPESDRINPTVGTIPSALLHDLQPELVVTLRLFGEKSLFDGRSTDLKPEFQDLYEPARVGVPLLAPVWGSPEIIILKKK